MCVTVCPALYYIDWYLLQCALTCSSQAFANDLSLPPQCQHTCQDEQYGYIPTRKCVKECPNGLFSYEEEQEDENGEIKRLCLDQCPAPTYANRLNMRCGATCPDGYYMEDTVQECTTECRKGSWALRSSRKCVNKCPRDLF